MAVTKFINKVKEIEMKINNCQVAYTQLNLIQFKSASNPKTDRGLHMSFLKLLEEPLHINSSLPLQQILNPLRHLNS